MRQGNRSELGEALWQVLVLVVVGGCALGVAFSIAHIVALFLP